MFLSCSRVCGRLHLVFALYTIYFYTTGIRRGRYPGVGIRSYNSHTPTFTPTAAITLTRHTHGVKPSRFRILGRRHGSAVLSALVLLPPYGSQIRVFVSLKRTIPWRRRKRRRAAAKCAKYEYDSFQDIARSHGPASRLGPQWPRGNRAAAPYPST